MRHASRLLGVLVLAAAGLLAGMAPAAAVSATDNFWISCAYTGQSATIDPIVDPGSTATEHFHDFYGNLSVTPDSTPATLQAAGRGATSCTTATDTAAYWAPTLVLGPGETQTYGPAAYPCTMDAAALEACHYSNIRAYYSTGGTPRTALTLIPDGEETVGGDHAATGPQPVNQIGWSCGGSTPFEPYPYDCTGKIALSSDQDGVNLRVVFPRCWDGTGTQPADFAYPANGTAISSCPAGYGKGLPLINVRFHTGIINPCLGETDPVTGAQVTCPLGSSVPPNFGFELADGTMMPWYQAHGDFMDGWQNGEGGLADLVTDCLIDALPCPVNPHTSPTSNMPT